MQDYFALLELPRLPWLNPETVKEHFIRLSSPLHPDRQSQAGTESSGNSRYAELNEAQRALSETRSRLRHLIELETGAPPSDINQVPEAVSDVFFEASQAIRPAEAFVRNRPAEQSAMQKVKRMEESLGHMERLKEVHERIQGLCVELEKRLEAMNEEFAGSRERAEAGGGRERQLKELADIWRDYSYLSKWRSQIRELQMRLIE